MGRSQKRFFILGGYGNTGRLIAELLLQETGARVVLGGRSRARGEALAAALNERHGGRRATAVAVDAADPERLRHAFAGVDLVVAASSTTAHAGPVARAALDAGADYLDTQLSRPDKRVALQALRPCIERAGRCFITDGGFHPGVPAALVHYAAPHFDRLETGIVSSLIRVDWKARDFSEATALEMIEEVGAYNPVLFRDGAWRRVSMNTYAAFDFPGFGRRYCAPMRLEEMQALPAHFPSLRETGFYVAGFNPFVDYVAMPLGYLAARVGTAEVMRRAARLFLWGLKRFSRPPYRTILQLTASGRRAGRAATLRLTLSHEDAYFVTAVPVVACLLQYLDGTIGAPGLYDQANIVAPRRFLHDVERLGITVQQHTEP